MEDERASEAAAIIWHNWSGHSRIESLPEVCRPASIAEGYEVQEALVNLTGWPPIGWKIAATSTAGQKHIGVDEPLAGRLLAGKMHRAGSELPVAHLHMAVIEAEFVFLLGEDLPARGRDYLPEDVVAATKALHCGLEVPDSRYENFTNVGAPQLIADNACTEFFVLGDAVSECWRNLDLAAHSAHLYINGKKVADGTGANVLGDPRIALAWLANDRVAQGGALRAGDIVTTGTCIVPQSIGPDDDVLADFGTLGKLSVRFTN